MMDMDDRPDPEPTAEQMRAIQVLTPADSSEIDALIMSCTSATFRRVARVVGTAMGKDGGRYGPVPDIYFAKRVAELVKAGRLESQGDLRRMRYSEVRLADE